MGGKIMKYIKNLFKAIRAFRWGKRLLTEYGERFRYFSVFYYSDDNQIGITVAYDHKYFSVMHVEKLKLIKTLVFWLQLNLFPHVMTSGR